MKLFLKRHLETFIIIGVCPLVVAVGLLLAHYFREPQLEPVSVSEALAVFETPAPSASPFGEPVCNEFEIYGANMQLNRTGGPNGLSSVYTTHLDGIVCDGSMLVNGVWVPFTGKTLYDFSHNGWTTFVIPIEPPLQRPEQEYRLPGLRIQPFSDLPPDFDGNGGA